MPRTKDCPGERYASGECKRTTEMNRRHALMRRYGLTVEEWEAILESQGYVCKLCGMDKILVPDHDHESGKVRGALCHGCNVGIGHLGDNVAGLERALAYLKGEL